MLPVWFSDVLQPRLVRRPRTAAHPRHLPGWQAAAGGAAARPSHRRPRGGSLRESVPTDVGNGGGVPPGAGRTATSCQSVRCASSPREAAGHRFAPGGLRLRRTTSPLPKPTSLRQRAAQAGRLASPGRRRPPGRRLGRKIRSRHGEGAVESKDVGGAGSGRPAAPSGSTLTGPASPDGSSPWKAARSARAPLPAVTSGRRGAPGAGGTAPLMAATRWWVIACS
jgi:hypothetical protein